MFNYKNIKAMENMFLEYPYDQETVLKINEIINKNPSARRIILQFPKKYLSQAFNLTKHLRKTYCCQQEQIQGSQKRQFYTLFDSMKKQCCTDIIGAQHINYDLLIHFGQACFSQQIKPNHYYLFPTLSKAHIDHFISSFTNQEFVQSLRQNKIRYLLTEQKMYPYAKNILGETFKKWNVELLKLPYDQNQNDEYLIFGYYASHLKQLPNNQSSNNILVLFSTHPQPDNKLLSDIHLTMGSFSANKKLFSAAPQIFVSSLQVPTIQKSTFNYAKPLMARLSQIGQLQKHEVFGLLVSNVGTKFSQKAVQNCKRILQKHHKKYYVFMMNNLNEVKFGNFPQIEVYVIISCFNNSCFSMKDFYRLVVTPMDLQVAFENVSIGQYNFDLGHPKHLNHRSEQQNLQGQDGISQEKLKQNDKTGQQKNLALSIQQKQEIILASTLQTLDYYRNKQYKGLDFSQKKPVQKIKKGKIGLAEQYKPLINNQSTQF